MEFQIIPQELVCTTQNSKVYRAYDVHSDRPVVAKLQPVGRGSEMENIVAMTMQCFKHFPRYYGSFIIPNSPECVSLFEPLGSDLFDLQRMDESNNRLSVSTVVKIMLQVIDAIELIHDQGFLHLDIKPQNILMGNKSYNKDTAYLIDYGLCEKYVDGSGNILEPHRTRSFVGTVRYASPNAHCYNQALSRRDDLWSLFYTAYEMLVGSLPWEPFEHNEKFVGIMKHQALYSPIALCEKLPPQMYHFVHHLEHLGYIDKPKYGYLKRMMRDILRENFIDIDTPYDWQTENKTSLVFWPPSRKFADG